MQATPLLVAHTSHLKPPRELRPVFEDTSAPGEPRRLRDRFGTRLWNDVREPGDDQKRQDRRADQNPRQPHDHQCPTHPAVREFPVLLASSALCGGRVLWPPDGRRTETARTSCR